MYRSAIAVYQDAKFLVCFLEQCDFLDTRKILLSNYRSTNLVVDLVSRGNIKTLREDTNRSEFFVRDLGHLRSRFKLCKDANSVVEYSERCNAIRYFVFYKSAWFVGNLVLSSTNYRKFQPLL